MSSLDSFEPFFVPKVVKALSIVYNSTIRHNREEPHMQDSVVLAKVDEFLNWGRKIASGP